MARRKDPATKHRVVSTTVLPLHHEALARLAAERHVPPSAIVREAIERYLASGPGPGREPLDASEASNVGPKGELIDLRSRVEALEARLSTSGGMEEKGSSLSLARVRLVRRSPAGRPGRMAMAG